jgi:hypothetical protein
MVKKNAKGRIVKITDSTLVLKKRNESMIIPSNEITYLKTKRSNKYNAIVRASYFLLSPIILSSGASIGYITTLFNQSKQYLFTGDIAKWKRFKEGMYSPQKY